MDWRLWFIQLSGWRVFLATVAVCCVLALALSVWLPRLSHRSVIQNALLAIAVLAGGATVLLLLLALLMR